MQNQVLRLENENLETAFANQDAEREASTLRTRVDELQALTDYLRRGQGGVAGGARNNI